MNITVLFKLVYYKILAKKQGFYVLFYWMKEDILHISHHLLLHAIFFGVFLLPKEIDRRKLLIQGISIFSCIHHREEDHQDTDSDEDDHTRDRIIDHHNIIEKYFYHHQDDKVESERPKWKDITSDAISECHECEDPPVHRHSESRRENIENMHTRNRKYI